MIDDTASQTPSRTPTRQYENNNKHQQQSLILLGEVGYKDHTTPSAKISLTAGQNSYKTNILHCFSKQFKRIKGETKINFIDVKVAE